MNDIFKKGICFLCREPCDEKACTHYHCAKAHTERQEAEKEKARQEDKRYMKYVRGLSE